MEGYLETNLTQSKEIIKKDWDMLFIVDGIEGSGKSVLTQQCAYVCDPTFNIDRIVFTPNTFQKAVQKANKFEAVVYDEAYTGLSSRAAMSMINRTLIKMLAEIRQKNLFIFVVCPTFFDLDKYVALWRSRALLHVYVMPGFKRGFFGFYNMERKKSLYTWGKKYYNYYKPKPNFSGRFPNAYVVDEEDYRHKKASSLTRREEQEEEKRKKREIEFELFKRVVSQPDLTPKKRMEILGITRSAYYFKMKQLEEEQEIVDEG